jgi:drug/metabolite transporter (DMT)-like permease
MVVASAVRGIIAMVAGAGLLTLSDATTKHLTTSYPLGQVLCLRQVAALLFILTYPWIVTGTRALRIVDGRGQLFRGALFLAGSVIVVVSLHHLPLAFVSILLFSSPLFVAIMSAPVLGERVLSYQWIAIAVGFVGVLLIVQPGGRSVEWIVLLPVLGAFLNALRDATTRLLSRTDTSISILFWSGVITCLGGICTVPFGWKPVDFEGGMWFLAAGLANAAAQFLVIEAFRLGNAALVAPFRYSGLVWAMLIGFLAWGEVPDAWMLTGMAIIVGAGVYMVRRGTRPA